MTSKYEDILLVRDEGDWRNYTAFNFKNIFTVLYLYLVVYVSISMNIFGSFFVAVLFKDPRKRMMKRIRKG
jgi:hypothetical protein